VRHIRSQPAFPPAPSLHHITNRRFTYMRYTRSQPYGHILLLMYSPTPNHILQPNSQAYSASACTRSNPSSWFRKKKKVLYKWTASHTQHAMSGLVRQPDNRPIGLIFFFFLASSRLLVGSRLTGPTDNRPSGLIYFYLFILCLFMAH
jgi:hypothetical protein